jgi:WD40 repeat protein
VWDSQSFQEINKIPSQTGSVDAVAFSPDGRWLAVGYQDGRLHVLDAVILAPRATLASHRDRVLIARFSPDSRTLVTGGIDRTVRLWNAPDFTLRSTFSWREGYPYGADFTPDGRTLAIGGGNRSEPHIVGHVLLCDVATGHVRATLSHQTCPKFLPDGRQLISVSDSYRIKRWFADPPLAAEVAP